MTTRGKPTGAELAEAWHAHRPYLVDLAFGMLGDIGAAEDAVQEAFARLSVAVLDQIEDQRGWLIVVTSRICLDQINSARSRRERPHEVSTIEFAGLPTPQALSVDPADRITLDEEVRMALLVVLQRLKPAERVVFVLHDVFRMPFDAIAKTMSRSAASCRQLARRAREKIRAENARTNDHVDATEQRLVVEQFVRACSNGDFSALVQQLDQSVWGDIDLGPADARTGQVRRGPRSVARNLLRYFGAATLVSNPVGGHAVVLAFVEQQLYAVILLTVENTLVKRLHVIADPNKILFLGSQLSLATYNTDL